MSSDGRTRAQSGSAVRKPPQTQTQTHRREADERAGEREPGDGAEAARDGTSSAASGPKERTEPRRSQADSRGVGEKAEKEKEKVKAKEKEKEKVKEEKVKEEKVKENEAQAMETFVQCYCCNRRTYSAKCTAMTCAACVCKGEVRRSKRAKAAALAAVMRGEHGLQVSALCGVMKKAAWLVSVCAREVGVCERWACVARNALNAVHKGRETREGKENVKRKGLADVFLDVLFARPLPRSSGIGLRLA